MSLPVNLSDLLHGRTIEWERLATGFPTIYNAMAKNGSPAPIFDTDDSTYFLVTLPVHEAFSNQAGDLVSDLALELKFNTLEDIINFCDRAGAQAGAQASNQVSNQVSNQANHILEVNLHGKVKAMLGVTEDWKSKEDIFQHIQLSNQHKNRVKYLDPLIEYGWIEMKFPDSKTHPEQRYKLTESGKRLLDLIK